MFIELSVSNKCACIILEAHTVKNEFQMYNILVIEIIPEYVSRTKSILINLVYQFLLPC